MSNPSVTHHDDQTATLLFAIQSFESVFIRFIRQHFGIVIHVHQVNELNKTILANCQKLNCGPEEYLQQLRTSTNKSALFDDLIAGITVGETYFFRDKRQMHLLEHILLPRLIQRKLEKNDLNLRIWSAACSTGEEIYTVAMLLNELIPHHEKWTFNLLASDINTRTLQEVKTAHFSQWSVRSMPAYYKSHYLTEDKRNYILSPEIRDLVRFEYINLNAPTYPSILNGTSGQDLILCRNVLIYFDRERITQVMKQLSNSLVEGGYLILGASDPILIDGVQLTFHDEEAIYFSRPYNTS